VLHRVSADLAVSRYTFGRTPNGLANSTAYRERLAVNTPAITWQGKTHESLLGGLRHVLLDDCLFVSDLRDNWGEGVRVPGRCFKVLYREARLSDWKVPSRHLAYLVQECPGFLPLEWMSNELLPAYLQVAVVPEETAWVYAMIGEGWERAGKLSNAGIYYTKALATFPSSKTAWRLCRVFFHLRDWQNCIAAYRQGVANLGTPQFLDLGGVYEHTTKILAAQAYYELGNKAMAKKFVDEACVSFPDSSPVALLKESIYGLSE
jgi:tetratricopeptide (TPR) repeat protein